MIITRLSRAENGTRTRDLNLGKVALYQLSYFRKMCDLLSEIAFAKKDRQKKRISKFGATEDPIFRHTWLYFGRGVLVKCRQRFIFACDLFASLTSSKILSFGNVQINLTLHSLIRIFVNGLSSSLAAERMRRIECRSV